MARALSFLILIALPLVAQTPPTASWFTEAGAAPASNILGGLGVAVSIAASQSLFAEVGLQTGAGVPISCTVLVGIKSDFPAVSLFQGRFVPFSILAYGASIQSFPKVVLAALSTATMTSVGTSAGLAQQYAVGVETSVKAFDIGIGVSGNDGQSGWHAYPFIFVARQFGKP
jgi:hypothetical protein